MLDPLYLQIISAGFALLFVLSALHKFGNTLQFRAVLEAYQILPPQITAVVARIVPVVELLLGLAWLFSAVLFEQLILVPLLSVILLTAYTVAICINLLRGRSYIDCGCGFSSVSVKISMGECIQQLSGGLVARNCLLVVVAMLASVAPTDRDLGVIDYLSFTAATVTLVLVYVAYNQLLMNNNAIGAWRNNFKGESDA